MYVDTTDTDKREAQLRLSVISQIDTIALGNKQHIIALHVNLQQKEKTCLGIELALGGIELALGQRTLPRYIMVS